MKKKYRVMGCGGTFDLFHKGHRDFLRVGLMHAEKLLIGIASDVYAAKRKFHDIESYEKRRRSVEEFLRTEGVLGKTEILPLDSVYIPKQWENEPIEAILVTPDSLPGAKKINQRRRIEKKPLLVVVPSTLSKAEDGLPISSSRIREGMIDREGRNWVEDAWYEKTLVLPPSLRDSLRRPFGEIIDAKENDFSPQEKASLITVGDVTTVLFHNLGIVPKLSVIDLLVERKQRYQTIEEMGLKNVNLTYTVQNTPGQVSYQVFRIVCDAFSKIKQGKTVLLHVSGEEDLTVLPILLQAPFGWILCYGQPGKGTVKVIVDEEIKMRCRDLLRKFTIR